MPGSRSGGHLVCWEKLALVFLRLGSSVQSPTATPAAFFLPYSSLKQ